MRKIQFNKRTASPVFFDMAGRFRPSRQATWYGNLWRIGDKAIIYGWLARWRKQNPHNKLTLLTDTAAHETFWGRQIPNNWLFSQIIDELIEDETGHGVMVRPLGENLYNQHILSTWRGLYQRPPLELAPTLPSPVSESIDQVMRKYKVPVKFAVVSPLFDAKYDRHRNIPPEWWHNVTAYLGTHIPVLVIGSADSMERYPKTWLKNVYPVYQEKLSVMQSFDLIRRASVYVGGETGLTLWAPLFKTPTVATYKFWSHPWVKNQMRGFETRPISAGAPVVWASPMVGPHTVIQQARAVMRH